MEHLRRHSVPALFNFADANKNSATISKDKLQFYTPQPELNIKRYKDLVNAPIKKERPRVTRRSSLPCVSSGRSNKSHFNVICKRLDFSKEGEKPTNKRQHPDNLSQTPSSPLAASKTTSSFLNDVFSDLHVERPTPPTKRVRFSEELKAAYPLATTPISNLRTPTSRPRLQVSNLRTPSSRPRLQLSNLSTPTSRSCLPLANLRTPASNLKTPVSTLHRSVPFTRTPTSIQYVPPTSSYNNNNMLMHKIPVGNNHSTTTTTTTSISSSRLSWRPILSTSTTTRKPQLFALGNGKSSLDTMTARKSADNLFKKTLQSTKAAKELDLLLK